MKKLYSLVVRSMNGTVTMGEEITNYESRELAEKVKAAVEEANKELDKVEEERYKKELAEWEELMCNPETKEKYRFAKPFLYYPSENSYIFIQKSVIYDNEDEVPILKEKKK